MPGTEVMSPCSSSTRHLGFSKRRARFSSSSSRNMAPILIRSLFSASVFGLTDESECNLINVQEALVQELSSYVFSPLREGDIALYRGSGNGVEPILLVAAEETSLGCVERLEHEYALKGELDADWAARPLALPPPNAARPRGAS